MPLAAAGDTWGVSGPVSLWWMYLPATVVVFIIVVYVRWRLARGRAPEGELHPYELAYLAEGRSRAVAAALARLHAEGVIEVDGLGRLWLAGPPTDGTPLDDAVYESVRVGNGARRWRDLQYKSRVSAAVDALADGLVRNGLLLGDRELRLRRAAVLPLALLCALGAVLLVQGLRQGLDDDDELFPFLLAATAALGLVMFAMLNDDNTFVVLNDDNNRPAWTAAGARAVHEASEKYAHLHPSHDPALKTYGPKAAAYGVAVFGAALLVGMAPGFLVAATAEEIVRRSDTSAAMGGGSGCSGSTSGCGSSSCGGSGCGGGCGGGGCGGGGGGCGG
ncbi:hypothetical protein Acsp04_07220 [Actinomadura sp. NBRC 104425]|uniref:TIGR04222 domain-containing membrane protein n=1 Tax=Actinomadura sp. NBRC 104425 TaxID=3032204 RepID=UPI0024A46751|nr:TIGR04222 domain-containing membrane protein [Actinomadura sp. NBRC 104425]GLZ10487.1 hypothetical protein Acsp04_07220 [Actinomadura sp. NBRC 104425]